MKHWLKRALATAALASGALIATAGMASASSESPLPVDPGAILSLTQEATNNNTNNQTANPSAETNQVNVYAPIAIGTHGSNNGEVDQSNEAETTVIADNENGTKQAIDQDQTAGDDRGDCGKCGSEGDSAQKQTAENNNTNNQTANPSAETNQVNVYAPVAVLSKDSNNGKVDQSNEAETTVIASNENGTKQSIDQDQTAGDDRGDCGKCGSEDGSYLEQYAENNNTNNQTANPSATTNQSNEIGSDEAQASSPTGNKGYESHRDSDDVEQSNEAETTVVANNENGTKQSIDQDQTAGDAGGCGKCGSEGDSSQTQTAENNNTNNQTANPSATTNQSNEIGTDQAQKSRPNGKTGYGSRGEDDVEQSNDAETKVVAGNENGTEQKIDQDQTARDKDDRDHKDKDDRDHKDKDDRDHKDKDDRDHKDKDDRDHKDKDDRDHKDKDDRDHKDKDDRDHKDKDDRDHKDKDDRDHKDKDDRDGKDDDHKDKDDRDHKDKDDRDHKDKDCLGADCDRCVRTQSQTAGNNNTSNQTANPSAQTNQSNSADRGQDDLDQSNEAGTKALAANRNGTGQSIGQSQHLSS